MKKRKKVKRMVVEDEQVFEPVQTDVMEDELDKAVNEPVKETDNGSDTTDERSEQTSTESTEGGDGTTPTDGELSSGSSEDEVQEEVPESTSEEKTVSEESTEAASEDEVGPSKESDISIKNLMDEETYAETERAAKEMMENIKNKTDTPLNIFLNAVKKANAAKAARAAKEAARAKKEEEVLDIMDIDELMEAVQNDKLPMCNIPDDITAVEVIKKELQQWEINETTLGYKTLLSIVEDFSAEALGHRPTAEEIVEHAAQRFDTKPKSIMAALGKLIKKANFENSVFIPVLKKVPREDLTWDAVVNEIIDFAE